MNQTEMELLYTGLTKEKAIELHRELWGWLAEHPEKGKNAWPKWIFNGGHVMSASCLCFACEYALQHMMNISSPNKYSYFVAEDLKCTVCPFIWPDPRGCQIDEDGDTTAGLFEEWANCFNKEEKIKIAIQIRDLPIREEVDD